MCRFATSFALAAVCLCFTTPRAEAGIIYIANLDGSETGSPGTGFAQVELDTAAHTMRVEVSFSGLTSGTTVAHIHAPTPDPFSGTAGVATTIPTFPGFPLGVTSGTYDMTFDTSSLATWNPAFVTANGGTALGAETALAAALAAGKAYLNIHTANFPGGEIRGFLLAVPEPSSVIMGSTSAILVLAVTVRRRARVAG